MPFGIGKFNTAPKTNFDKGFSKNLNDGAFSVAESGGRSYKNSEIRFYNTDSLWSRWRRGYELYTLTQSMLGSTAGERQRRGDYRLYFTFQQFPGVFIPARLYTFPSTNQELGEHIVGMRDTDAFSFYDYGLPILGVRYLGKSVSATYSQSGTTLVVTKQDHGLYPGESVWLDISTGGGVDETLSIVSTTQNTFTVTIPSLGGTITGNVDVYDPIDFCFYLVSTGTVTNINQFFPLFVASIDAVADTQYCSLTLKEILPLINHPVVQAGSNFGSANNEIAPKQRGLMLKRGQALYVSVSGTAALTNGFYCNIQGGYY